MFVNGCLFVVILVIYGECLKIFDSVVINVFGVIVFSCFNVQCIVFMFFFCFDDWVDMDDVYVSDV